MKLPELIQNIKSTLYNNRVPNTTLLDDRQIIYWINEQRALWLKREYNQLRPPLHNEIQVLYNVEFEEVIDTDVIEITNDSLLRSKKKIPRTIQWLHSDGVLTIRGNTLANKPLNYIRFEDIAYVGNGKFNRNQIYVFRKDDYLWIKYGSQTDKSKLIKELIIEGVFENPLEVDIFNQTINDIRFGRSEYPVSEAFLPFIEGEIFKTHIQRFIKDVENNDEEDYKNPNPGPNINTNNNAKQ